MSGRLVFLVITPSRLPQVLVVLTPVFSYFIVVFKVSAEFQSVIHHMIRNVSYALLRFTLSVHFWNLTSLVPTACGLGNSFHHVLVLQRTACIFVNIERGDVSLRLPEREDLQQGLQCERGRRQQTLVSPVMY